MTAQLPHNLRNLLILIIILVIVITILSSSFIFDDTKSPNHDFKSLEPTYFTKVSRCYKHPEKKSIKFFEDVLDAKKQPMPGKAIFFHETTCSMTGIFNINSKQACAIESAARQNSERDIFVLFASSVGIPNNNSLPKFYDKLQKYRNIEWRNINLWRYSHGTSIANWLKETTLFNSSFLFEHMSDIVRAITMYKYGGFHMDLDVVVQRSLDDLGEDFIADDWSTVVNGAILHLNNYGIGREVSQRFFNEVIRNFDGNIFIANGPTMLTRIFEEICGTKNRTFWTQERCHGLKLQSKELFYPISWSNYTLYFEPDKIREALELTQNSTIIHVWNDRSKDIWNKVGTNNAYQFVAERKCPVVYTNSEYL